MAGVLHQQKLFNTKLGEAGFEIIGDGLKAQWMANDADLAKCVEYGKNFAEACK